MFTACTAGTADADCGSDTNAYCDNSHCACNILHTLAEGVCAPKCKLSI